MTITANVAGIKSGGFNLVTQQVGNVLTAYQDVDGDGIKDAGETTAVFTLTVNPTAGTSGQYVFNLITPLDPTVTDTPIGGSSSFGAGPTGYQILTGGAPVADLSVISGYLVDTVNGTDGDGTFDAATWLATGVLSASQIASAGINGSTAGWGVDNNGFEDPNELMFFDFGSQATADPDAGGPFVPPVQGPDVAGAPPEVQMPNITFATFEFINYSSGVGNLGDDIAFVAHYVDAMGNPAGFASGFIPDGSIDGALWTHNAPGGLFLADIQFYSGMNPDGSPQDLQPGKIDLVSVGVTTSTLDRTIPFSVQLTDGDNDPTTTANFSVHVATGLVPFAPAAPVVLDTNGDGVVGFLDQGAGVVYDYGNDGMAEGTAWVAPGDSILVRDANGNGLVDDASEFVFGGNGQTDMEALHAQYGVQLDASDADFVMFAVWNDANSNGIADDGELSSLAEAGIASIGLVSDGIAYTAANGDVAVAGSSSFTRTDGSTGIAADAAFRTGSRFAVESERVAANSNNVVLAAAVAAAGLAASAPAAAAIDANSAGSAKSFNPTQVSEAIDVSAFGVTTDTSVTALMTGMGDSLGAAEMPFQSGRAFDFGHESIGELAGNTFDGMSHTALLQGTDMIASPMAMPTMASNVAMPSAEALIAMAGLDAGQSAVSVESIVANALQGGGGPDIDALLSALPGQGIGADAGLDALASLGNGTVPSWDMGHGAGFTLAGPNAITTEALVLHHDAIQPIANG